MNKTDISFAIKMTYGTVPQLDFTLINSQNPVVRANNTLFQLLKCKTGHLCACKAIVPPAQGGPVLPCAAMSQIQSAMSSVCKGVEVSIVGCRRPVPCGSSTISTLRQPRRVLPLRHLP